jgi:hypothetical protein
MGNAQLNQHAQPYVHLYPTEILIFHLAGSSENPHRVRVPNDDAQRTGLHRYAEIALEGMGWELGIDHWRQPLDPDAPLVATAHIYPLGEREHWAPFR